MLHVLYGSQMVAGGRLNPALLVRFPDAIDFRLDILALVQCGVWGWWGWFWTAANVYSAFSCVPRVEGGKIVCFGA